MDRETALTFVFAAIISTIVGVANALAPIPDVKKMWSSNSTIGVTSSPPQRVINFLVHLLFFWHSLPFITNSDGLLVLINGVAILVDTAYIYMYIRCANPTRRVIMAVASGLSVLLFTIVAAVSLLGFKGHHREPVVMWCLFTAQMVACLWPIYSGYLVITTQTVNHISLFEISNGVLAELAWLCYGIYRHNTLFTVPRAVMCVLLMLQVMIYESVANHGVNIPNPQALRDMIVRVTPVNEDV